MKNFNSILSILLPGLVKYENVVNKIYSIIDVTLKQYNNNKHIEYNRNNVIILDKIQLIQKISQDSESIITTQSVDTLHSGPSQDSESIINILDKLQDIYDLKNLININFGIVTLKPVLHIIKNEFSETKTNTIDKKILEATNILNSIILCENAFINELVNIFIEYFNINKIYIEALLDKTEKYRDGYIKKIIIGIINVHKYNPEYIDKNKQAIEFLYKSIYLFVYNKTHKSNNIDVHHKDIWYIPNKLVRENGVIYKLENLLTPQTPALHIVNGISNNIVTKFNTIAIAPVTESKYKIIKNYDNIYIKNYLREEFMNTGNIKFTDTKTIIERYIEWKDSLDSDNIPSILIQILAKNFNKQIVQKIGSFSDFLNLISCFTPKMSKITYNTYLIQSFSEFYFESINRFVAAQFLSGHTNALFDNQVACDNNFMKEAFISNLINIKMSAKTLQKKIIDAVNTTFKSDIYNILTYHKRIETINDAWLTLFKSIIKSIIDPDKNIKSRFIEKINIVIPKARLKHFIMRNPGVILN